MDKIKIQARTEGLSSCCGEVLMPIAEILGNEHIKVKLYCINCLRFEKVYIRSVKVKDRRAA
ncbi:MAG: hypothetical protein V1933_07980 [Candidatus Omnitrophota bacterium]